MLVDNSPMTIDDYDFTLSEVISDVENLRGYEIARYSLTLTSHDFPELTITRFQYFPVNVPLDKMSEILEKRKALLDDAVEFVSTLLPLCHSCPIELSDREVI